MDKHAHHAITRLVDKLELARYTVPQSVCFFDQIQFLGAGFGGGRQQMEASNGGG